MSWKHPDAPPLRLQVLEEFVQCATPAGCVTRHRPPVKVTRIPSRFDGPTVVKADPKTLH